jgi:hypothetical protein
VIPFARVFYDLSSFLSTPLVANFTCFTITYA